MGAFAPIGFYAMIDLFKTIGLTMAQEDIYEGGPTITPEQVRIKATELLKKRSVLVIDAVDRIADADWIKESTTIRDVDLDGLDEFTRFASSADFQFEDTTLGGNFVINPRPQFTRYCDTRAIGILKGRNKVTIGATNGNIGMGHYYSEAINATHQTIHMRFGVPEFNSLISFFTSFYDNETAQAAKSGRFLEGLAYSITKPLALVVNIVFFPLLAAHSIGVAARFFMRKPASKFYYLKPTMTTYWTAVTSIVNQIAVYKGMLPDGDNGDPPYDSVEGKAKVDAESMQAMQKLFPNLYTQTGFIDIYKVANRAQRIRNNADMDIARKAKSMTYEQFQEYSRDFANQKLDYHSGRSLQDAMKDWSKTKTGKAENIENPVLDKHIRTPDDPKSTTLPPDPNGWSDHMLAEFMDGSQFATFRVDYTGSVDESFSSSTVESDISSKFNSMSAQGRAASFSFANGNIDGGPLSALMGIVKGITAGVADALHISGIASLAGAAFVDIPQHWDNSAANLPKMSYTMQLVSPYGNAMSQMMDLYIPMAMLLAAALPISTGKQSYSSPFLVELYDQGKAQTRLGIIDSLTFVRGTTNLGFSKNKNFMSVDVSFSVKDLSSVMHMPMNSGFSLNPLKGVFDEDTVYTDYLHVLASATLGQNIYPMKKLRENLRVKAMTLRALTSAPRWIGTFHDMPYVGMIDAFFKDTYRR